MKSILHQPYIKILFTLNILLLTNFLVTAQNWTPIGFGPQTGVFVNAIAIDTISGDIYAGGQFQASGSVTPNIAKRTGLQWDSLSSGMNNTVHALTLFNGELYAGGYFTIAGSTQANYIAKWNGSDWLPLGTGMNDAVFALEVYNNELYAAGNFTMAGGVSANRIAKWDGSNWLSVDLGCNNPIRGLKSFNGLLYVGGSFTTAGAISANGVASWDGSNWSSLSTGMNTNGSVRAFGIYNGELYLGGFFSQAGGVNANNIVKWNGTSFEALSSGLDDIVLAIEFYNCELYVSGAFTSAGGIAVSELAKYNSIGGWSAVATPANTGSFFDLDFFNGELYAAGYVFAANANIQKLNSPVPAPPLASFTPSQTDIRYNKKIKFTSTSLNAVNYKWYFPGGTPSVSFDVKPLILYQTVGDFDVQLIVSNCMGSDTVYYSNLIHVDSLIHQIPIGTSSEIMTIVTPPATTIITGDYEIYYYKPVNYDSLSSPVLLYIHGQGATGTGMVDILDIANRQNALIVSPSMHNGYGYVSETLYDSITGCNSRLWMTEVVKQIYQNVLMREQRSDINTYLTGFSEGAQFTSRYMLIRQFSPDSIPIKMAVSVSASNYTLMTDTFNNAVMNWINYKCGLAGVEAFTWNCTPVVTQPVSEFICNEHIIQYYNENYGVLAGTADISQFPSFCGYAQGTDRYDRAKIFHAFSTTDAIARGTILQWPLDSVVNVGHSNNLMYNTKLNVNDSITIAENLIFNTPYHNVPQLSPTCFPTGLSETQSINNQVSLVPNPNDGIFDINIEEFTEICDLNIYNSFGQLVFTQKITSGFNQIDMSNQPGGIYFYHLLLNKGSIKSGKIVLN